MKQNTPFLKWILIFRKSIFIFTILFGINTVKAQTTLALKFFIQGYYIGGGLMTPAIYNEYIGVFGNSGNPYSSTDVTDNTGVNGVIIGLQSVIPSSTPTYAFNSTRLQTNGFMTSTFSTTISAGSYYIIVQYKSSVKTWSKSITIPLTNPPFDFTLSADQAFLSNQAFEYSDINGNLIITEATIFKMYSGDINLDGAVDGTDFLILDPALQTPTPMLGHPANIDGSQGIDLIDWFKLNPNIQTGVGSTGSP